MVFLTSTAMGMGVTLTAASNALFVERQWTPGMEEQMEDRIHRIGQNRGVFIHYMQIENSIDAKMAKLVEYKRDVLAAVLDGEKQRDRGESIINELLSDLSNQ
jgi:SWI/SNF-related matrix-associated actin-dependent regulator 1 of chromatin subfamily A